MRISPVNIYNYQSQNNIQPKKAQNKPQMQQTFTAFYDDDELFAAPSNGYSILDLFKSKKPKVTKEEQEEILENWDPDLGDISDLVDPKNNNFGSLEDLLRDYEAGKLDEEDTKEEPEPPSIFSYEED